MLQLTGINSVNNGDTVDGQLNALNNQYIVVDTDQQSLTPIAALADATTLALNDATCNFESPDGVRFANLDSVSEATFQVLYFSTDAEAADADANSNSVSAPVACSISGGIFTCNGQTTGGQLDQLLICNDADTGNVSFLAPSQLSTYHIANPRHVPDTEIRRRCYSWPDRCGMHVCHLQLACCLDGYSATALFGRVRVVRRGYPRSRFLFRLVLRVCYRFALVTSFKLS